VRGRCWSRRSLEGLIEVYQVRRSIAWPQIDYKRSISCSCGQRLAASLQPIPGNGQTISHLSHCRKHVLQQARKGLILKSKTELDASDVGSPGKVGVAVRDHFSSRCGAKARASSSASPSSTPPATVHLSSFRHHVPRRDPAERHHTCDTREEARSLLCAR
jgi:hypothetical protein